MVYRLLAVDIDGTLLTDHQKLTRRTKEAIDYVKKKDVYVTLVTERHFHSAKKVARALKIETPLVTQSGAFIAASLDHPWYEEKIDADTACRIIEILENEDCHIRLIHERYAVANKIRQRSELMAKMSISLNEPLFYPVTFVDQLAEYTVENNLRPAKISVQFPDRERLRAARNVLNGSFSEVSCLAADREETKLDIVAGGVSKAAGLAILARKFGVPMKEVVAIGDGPQDLEMIRAAGLGVAMNHAPKAVKKAADWITRSNNQNGVGYMVKEVFRKQMRVQL